ncbi:MAG: hypothetical protein ACRETO_09995 [Gammaproteobacteria bacterium]
MFKQALLCLMVAVALCVLSGCDNGKGSAAASQACRATNSKTCIIDDVAYGAGVFVAVGQGGPSSKFGSQGPWVEVSTDGISWKPMDPGYTSNTSVLTSIAYGAKGFVATDGQRVIYSAKGQSWTVDKFSAQAGEIENVEYDGSRYILYTSNTTPASPLALSTNGIDWQNYGVITDTSSTAGGTPTSIVKVSSTYYATWQGNDRTAPNYQTATSSDGLVWTPGNPASDTTTEMSQLLYANKKFIAFGSDSSNSVSINTNVTWGLVAQGTDFNKLTISKPIRISGQNYAFSKGAYNGQAYVGIGVSGAFESTDAANWSQIDLSNVMSTNSQCDSSNSTNTVACIATVGIAAAPSGSFVIVSGAGGRGAESMDGVTWVTSNL